MEDITFRQEESGVSPMTIVSLIIANIVVTATLIIPMALYLAIQ